MQLANGKKDLIITAVRKNRMWYYCFPAIIYY